MAPAVDLCRTPGVVQDQPEALIVLELNRRPVMQKIVLGAHLEAEHVGVPLDPGLKPDDIELNDIDA
jgi:hypothetical protein